MKNCTITPAWRFALVLVIAVIASGCDRGIVGGSTSGPIVRDPPTPIPPPGGGDPPPPTGPVPAPQVSLAVRDDVVNQGGSTVLSWSSNDASGCQASGGWGGSRPVQGSASVGPISQQTTYTLSCNGTGGTGMVMLSVRVNGTVTLSWQSPAARVDGTPIDELGGFRIFYGSRSRDYREMVEVRNEDATQRSFQLASGSYYFAMTAFDGDGLESGYSNEVIRRVN